MSTEALFQPLRLGALELQHRVVMAPLTRLRSRQPGDVPQALNALYYGQRASAGGLIITEATDTSPQARGYPGAPGVHSAEQVEGWRAVAEAVHAKGGLLVNQIWHTGRVSHSSLQPGGAVPVAPSAIARPGRHMDATGASVPTEVPRALETDEIPGVVDGFRRAALNARAAGFDGVEIQGANGYLLDQFLHESANRRTDAYGGSVANRTRLLLEVVEAVSAAWSADRVGVRLSPWSRTPGISDSDTPALFTHAIGELGKRGLGYLHLVEPRNDMSRGLLDPDSPDAAAAFRDVFGGAVMAAGGFTRDTAAAALADGRAEAVAFGRLFLANPDLPERLRRGAALNAYDRSTFYGGGAKGYTDYPFLDASVRAA